MAVIEFEHVSKAYRLGAGRTSLREAIAQVPRKLFSRNGVQTDGQLFWALNDVSFRVEPGEVLGIIGPNGAGKSTILKLLSKVTFPTSGHIQTRGRMAALIELGAGFHPDLTGRENVYLNGTILGLKKQEIDAQFSNMVEFAGLEKFIDTPIKRYSSGMYVRLAFAVAAHVKAELLLVDEVLSVGDMTFQQKSLAKMNELRDNGATIVFISHNLPAVQAFCSRVLLLRSGRIVANGDAGDVIQTYRQLEREKARRAAPRQVGSQRNNGVDLAPEVKASSPSMTTVEQYLPSRGDKLAEAFWSFEEAPGTDTAKLRSVRALNDQGEVCFDMWMNKPVILKAQFWILRRARVDVSFHLYNQLGDILFASGSFHDATWISVEREPGLYEVSCTIPKHYLNEGLHSVMIYVHHGADHIVDVEIPAVVSFNVQDPGDTRFGWTGPWAGLVRPILPWKGERIGDLLLTKES